MKTKELKKRAVGVSHPKKKQVSVLFSEEEGKIVEDGAKQRGYTVAGFMRYAALQELKRTTQG